MKRIFGVILVAVFFAAFGVGYLIAAPTAVASHCTGSISCNVNSDCYALCGFELGQCILSHGAKCCVCECPC